MSDRPSSLNSTGTKSGKGKPLGQVLYEAGLISAQQIEIALQEQVKKPYMKIGEIFASKGWIKQQTADFFVEQWDELLKEKTKQPLVYYLQRSALLDREQINSILKIRSSSQEKLRFHHIAVQQGLIKQQTADFFLKNLLGISGKRKNYDSLDSTITPYKILQNYIRGETEFPYAELTKIKLNNVTLRGVNLNNSNLSQAELKQANLSNSSLRLANLADANLEKAILTEVDFERACLDGVNLTDAHLKGANFKQASLRLADLRDSYLVNVCFQGANLKKTKLQGANLKGALYDAQTSFDTEFNPGMMGMKLVE